MDGAVFEMTADIVEYARSMGNQDFSIDLVFFHRGLSCRRTPGVRVVAM